MNDDAESLEAQLQQTLTEAMRAKDRVTLDAVRNVKTELQRAATAENASGDSSDDDFVRGVIAAYVKKLRKALEQYDGLGERGAEQATKLRAEIDVLGHWLPQVLDEQATAELVDRAIAEVGATDPSQSGKVMGAVMKTDRDRVDPAVVKRIVADRLGG